MINKLDSLSPEQWKQLQKKKAKFDSLSPAQKKMIRARLKNRYDSLSVTRTKLSKKNMKELNAGVQTAQMWMDIPWYHLAVPGQ